MARIDWRLAESDADKADYWKKRTGSDAPPIQAWYWRSGFEEGDVDAAFLDLLRAAFWSRREKACVIMNVDVKIEESPYMIGSPILRVTMPDRFVPSFGVGEHLFVLCQARSDGDAMVDYIGLWDSTLERRDVEVSHTRFAGPLSGDAATDVPPPLAMIRGTRAPAPHARPVSLPSAPPPVPVVPLASATDAPNPAGVLPVVQTHVVAPVIRATRPPPARLPPTLPEPPARPRPPTVLSFPAPPRPPAPPAVPDPALPERDRLPDLLAAGIGLAFIAVAILYALS